MKKDGRVHPCESCNTLRRKDACENYGDDQNFESGQWKRTEERNTRELTDAYRRRGGTEEGWTADTKSSLISLVSNTTSEISHHCSRRDVEQRRTASKCGFITRKHSTLKEFSSLPLSSSSSPSTSSTAPSSSSLLFSSSLIFISSSSFVLFFPSPCSSFFLLLIFLSLLLFPTFPLSSPLFCFSASFSS